ncbi:MAG TPA: RNA-processing protein [Methanomicrobiales archaeon]|nr:RNA-processing protein [Methanomicrobiales archaeon]
MRSYWFGDVEAGGCMKAGGDPGALVERLKSIGTSPADIIPPDWKLALGCGAVKDRADYLARLREICIRMARDRVVDSFRGEDTELIRMVMALDGIDQAMNKLAERLAEWHGVLHPEEGRKYRPRDSRKVLARIGEDADGSLKELLDGVLKLREIRVHLAEEISGRAAEILPNCATLVGGLVAARVMTLAGGLSRLAQLPASSIQVLGARGALFSHLTHGTPPPKHGIIFQHARVHSAPRKTRGKVARVLAGRLAIAARLDLYRGTLDPGFIGEADRMIESAGGRR